MGPAAAARLPVPCHLVLAGGGHTHALLLRMWAMEPQRRPNAWITLVNRGGTALYSGTLPALVAGILAREDGAIDLRRLADRAGVGFVEAEISGLDPAKGLLLLAGRPALRFDWLSLDVGAVVAAETPGTLPVKPLEPFLAWCAERPAGQAVEVLGSGAAAVEVALALKARGLTPRLHTRPGGLALGSRAANRRLERLLSGAGIPLLPAGANGAALAAQAPRLACTGSRGPSWLARGGLPVDGRGRVRTAASLQVEGHPQIFACGDCGVVADDPRPASGVWAVRAAPLLAANLERGLRGAPLRRWRPQRRALQLLGDGGVAGRPRAVALWGPLALGPSRWLWRWKNHLDRAFLRRFDALPAMAAPACRGCAAKLAAEPLRLALGRLAAEEGGQPAAPGTPPPPAVDAAALGLAGDGRVWLQSVDGFPALVSDPWLNGRLTCLHACSDLWASGADVRSALAVVTLPQAAAALQADLLHQTLAGVRSVLAPLGAELLGGHTLEARDALAPGPGMPCPGLALILTVNGAAPLPRQWRKGPLQPGDALILTRPIGTGVLFAAAMHGAARPAWIERALAVMQQSQAALVTLLAGHGCQACTDITGFGLLGHLGEMLAASTAPAGAGVAGLTLNLDPGAIPVLPGALELLAAGHASSLAPANAGALTLLEGPVRLEGGAGARAAERLALLVDPQTCGPLLAAVPDARAADALRALAAAGFGEAAVIARVNRRA